MSNPKHGEQLSFSFTVSLNDLIDCGGMEDMNEIMDEQFSEQFTNKATLTDIHYRAIGTTGTDDIMIEATGIVEYWDGDPDEEDFDEKMAEAQGE